MTLIVKDIRVAREAKGTWRVVFWWTKSIGAAEVARRSELHAERHFYLEKAARIHIRTYKMQSLPRRNVKDI